jgi:hypothetical protein
MRVIPLLQEPSTTFDPLVNPLEAEADRVDYVHTIRQIIRKPSDPRRGASLAELSAGCRLLKLLDGKKAGDSLWLDESDWNYLCDKTITFGWPAVDERLLRLADSILSAEEAKDGIAEGLDGDGAPVPDEHGLHSQPDRGDALDI